MGWDEGREQGGEGAGGELDTFFYQRLVNSSKQSEGLVGFDMPLLCSEYVLNVTILESAPLLLAYFPEVHYGMMSQYAYFNKKSIFGTNAIIKVCILIAVSLKTVLPAPASIMLGQAAAGVQPFQ